jgi:hypothetical protein
LIIVYNKAAGTYNRYIARTKQLCAKLRHIALVLIRSIKPPIRNHHDYLPQHHATVVFPARTILGPTRFSALGFVSTRAMMIIYPCNDDNIPRAPPHIFFISLTSRSYPSYILLKICGMSQLNEANCGPEGLPLSVRRYIYRKEDFSQIVHLERERLYRSMDSIKTMSNAIYNDGNLDALEEPEDVTEYIIFSIDTATHDRDFLDPNNEPKLSIRTTFDQNINSLAVKMVVQEHEELSYAINAAISRSVASMGLERSIYHYGSTTIPVANGHKQPDAAVGPKTTTKWKPTKTNRGS